MRLPTSFVTRPLHRQVLLSLGPVTPGPLRPSHAVTGPQTSRPTSCPGRDSDTQQTGSGSDHFIILPSRLGPAQRCFPTRSLPQARPYRFLSLPHPRHVPARPGQASTPLPVSETRALPSERVTSLRSGRPRGRALPRTRPDTSSHVTSQAGRTAAPDLPRHVPQARARPYRRAGPRPGPSRFGRGRPTRITLSDAILPARDKGGQKVQSL